MVRRIFALMIGLTITILSVFAADPATPITVKSTTPANGDKVSYISTIRIEFDITDVLSLYPDVPAEDFGVANATRTISIYKGEDATGEIVGSTKIAGVVNTSAAFTTNKLYTEITFDSDVILEANQVYCIVIPAKSYSVSTTSNKYTNTVNLEPIQIIVYGDDANIADLLLVSYSPDNESTVDVLSDYIVTFNKEVAVVPDAYASLYEGADEISKAPIAISESDAKSVIARFSNVPLYNTHSYTVVIPENVIFDNDDNTSSYKEISSKINGSSLKYFGYSLVSPSYNKRVDNLGRVAVTLDCTDQEYLGRDFKAQAQLYKVEDDETMTPVGDPIACATSESTRGFYVDVYNFNLEPSSVYKIVVEEGQFHLWNTETQKPLHDTANERMEFQYRTPDEIEPMPTQAFGAATPSEAESPEKLTAFRLDFEQYVYDSQFYYPVFVSYDANTLSVVDKTTGENVAEFAVDIKWDNMNNYWLENVDPLDVTMLEGHEYEVTVPAGMFCCRFDPLKEVSMNEAYTVAYKGGYATSFTLTYAVEGQATLVTEVARDSEVTVSFPENDGFKVVAIAFNGEEQEVDGSFTTPAISEDSVLDIAYEYASEIDYNFTTGISLPEDCPFSVRSEGSILIISGVRPGDTVSIYSIGGLLMANLGVVPDKTKEVCFTLDNDKVYIVRINNKTLKIQH